MDFDTEAYAQWSEWTSARCKVQDIDADSSDILFHEKTWEIIMERLDAVNGVFRKKEEK